MGFRDNPTPGIAIDDDEPTDAEESDLKEPPVLRLVRTTPILDDLVPLALAAQRRGDAFIDYEMDARAREWVGSVWINHVRGKVVGRIREAPRGAAAVDSGRIVKIRCRFEVMAVLEMHRREILRRYAPRDVLKINQPRRRPRNISIR